MWPEAIFAYWNKRRNLHKNRVQFPKEYFTPPTWPPFLCLLLQHGPRDVMWTHSIVQVVNNTLLYLIWGLQRPHASTPMSRISTKNEMLTVNFPKKMHLYVHKLREMLVSRWGCDQHCGCWWLVQINRENVVCRLGAFKGVVFIPHSMPFCTQFLSE